MKALDDIRSIPVPSPTVSLVALLVCLASVNQFAISIYLPAIPAMSLELGASSLATKATLTVYLLTTAVSVLIFGPLSDRFGRRPVLLAGLAVYTLASLACALAPTIEVLLAARIAQAFGGAAGTTVSRATTRDTMEGPDLTRTNAYTMTGQGISPALAPLLGSLLLEGGSWRWTFFLTGLFGAGLLAAVYLGLQETNHRRMPRIDVKSLAAAFGSILRNRTFLGAVGTGALCAAPWYAYFGSSADLIIGRFGVSPSAFGSHMMVIVGLFMAGGIACARLAKRWSEQALLVGGILLAAGGAWGFAGLTWLNALSFEGVVATAALFGAGIGFLYPITVSIGIRPFPEKAGTAASAFAVIFMTGASLGSLLPALVSADVGVGLPAVMAISMLLSLACLALVLLPAIGTKSA